MIQNTKSILKYKECSNMQIGIKAIVNQRVLFVKLIVIRNYLTLEYNKTRLMPLKIIFFIIRPNDKQDSFIIQMSGGNPTAFMSQCGSVKLSKVCRTDIDDLNKPVSPYFKNTKNKQKIFFTLTQNIIQKVPQLF